MLTIMNNLDLIDHVLKQEGATEAELLLAERLTGAIDEVERLTQSLREIEALQGTPGPSDGADA